MTETELQERRRHKWRLDGRPMRTLDEAREFMESVGFCLMYPLKPPVLAPTFVGAYAGNDENLPTWQHVFADPRATESMDLMVRLLRERSAYETNLFGKTNFLVSAAVFPFFYALMGDRNPRRLVRENSVTGHGKLSALANDVYRAIQDNGPITTKKFGGLVGGELSDAGLDRALNELWASLMITRVDYNAVDGASWDVLYRWSPEAVKEGTQLSVAEAVSALVSKYLDCVVAAEPQEVEDFFTPMVAKSRVSEAIKALLTTRDFSFSHTGERSLVCMSPQASGPRKFPRMPRITSSRHQGNASAEVGNSDQEPAKPAPEIPAGETGVLDGIPTIQGKPAAPPQTVRACGPQENSIFKRRIPAAGMAGQPWRPPAAIDSRNSGSRNPGAAKSRPQGKRSSSTSKPPAGSRPAYSRPQNSGAPNATPAYAQPAVSPGDRPRPDRPRLSGAGRPSAKPSFPRRASTGYRSPGSDSPSSGSRPAYAKPVSPDAGSTISPPADAGSSFPQPAGSGYVKPAFAKTGFAKSRVGNSGLGNKFGKPRSSKPRFDKPGSDKPRFDKPRFGKPQARRSSFGRPPSRKGKFGDSRPTASRSGEPTSGAPSSSEPRSAGSGFSGSRSDDTRSRAPRSGPPRFGKPRFGKPDSQRSGPERSWPQKSSPGKSRPGGGSSRPGFSRAKPGSAKSSGGGFGGSRFGKSKTSKDGNYLPRRSPRNPAGSAPLQRPGKIRDLKEKPGSEPES